METDATEVKAKPSKPRLRTPHWDTWRKRPFCHLSDAVAISFNLSPWVIKALKKKNSPRYKNYLSRLKTASLATSPDGGETSETIKEIKDHPERGDDPYDRIISLASFVAFVRNQESWRDKLPIEFIQLDEVQHHERTRTSVDTTRTAVMAESSSSQTSVILPHMTDTLKAVFEVMRNNWSDYNPARLPKQMDLAHQIDKALGWKSQKNGDASRNAQVFAAAIRPDALKNADRRANGRKS